MTHDAVYVLQCLCSINLFIIIIIQYLLLLYLNLSYAITTDPTCVTWCAKINSVARFHQCSVMFPGNMASRDPCFQGTWCKPCDTMHLRRFFGPTSVLGISIRILCCCVMDDDTNLLHLFRYVTKLVLTVSLDQHWKIMLQSCAMLPTGQTSQYLYIIYWSITVEILWVY